MTKNILIVDDEKEMRLALSEALTLEGYDVSTANDGIDALSKFSSDKFDMVITDIKMPRVSGIEVLREIKRRSVKTPVVMITAYGTIDNAVEAIKEGAFDYILKPFSLETIEAIVGRALVGQAEDVKERSQYRISSSRFKEIITMDKAVKNILNTAANISSTKATVLIQGESGTGKELFARFIHQSGSRKDKPFVAVNCASLPETLLESELFGHEKGAFTGAVSRKTGKFELADGGTILLDEISEMTTPLQAKLLRVLQEHEIDIVGGKEPIPLDIRVIATTNRDIQEEIKKGTFREDLYYRLNVISLYIPPLRERLQDIPVLAEYFVKKHSEINGLKERKLSKDGMAYLIDRKWRGNVRELENFIERAVLLSHYGGGDETIGLSFLKNERGTYLDSEPLKERTASSSQVMTLRDMEKELIFNTLASVDGNRTKAASILDISIRTLRNKLNEYKEGKAT